MRNVFLLIVGACLLCAGINVVRASDPVAQPEWREVKNADGIQVYSRQLAGERLVRVKATAVINAGIIQLLDILDNIEDHPRWVPYLVETRVLYSFSATEKLVYNLFDAPWPAADRDYVYRVFSHHGSDGVITYTMKSEPSPLMPEQPGIVRAELLAGIYTLTPVSGTQTKVEFSFHADPGGHLPTWLVNIIQRGFPFNSLRNLRKLVVEEVQNPTQRRKDAEKTERLIEK